MTHPSQSATVRPSRSTLGGSAVARANPLFNSLRVTHGSRVFSTGSAPADSRRRSIRSRRFKTSRSSELDSGSSL